MYNDVDRVYPAIAVAIFNENHEILLQKRKDLNQWGLISGHIEIGETVKEAVIREVKEETGLIVNITRMIGVYSDPTSQIIHYPNGKTTHFITNYFEAEIIGGKLRIDESESVDIRFFKPNELPDNLLTMDPSWLEDALDKKGCGVFR
ncbi:NUDIX domain-containing protein [Erysipelothrix urinaevulpis]|uniref:NUDIX domain-containing protein n=1 Tax=Erysipelothrix urinaevulpis TaxID=2683717 RepID=UPI0013583EA5|nr:NUDIX domain-containing protein [Erysipelothrix urinaevulpis]